MSNHSKPRTRPEAGAASAAATGSARCGIHEGSHHWIGDTCAGCGIAWHVWAQKCINELTARYSASLALALQLAKELRTICDDKIHREQVDDIMQLISEHLPNEKGQR